MPGESGVRRVVMTADCVGGVWTYALDLARGLIAKGVSVTIALMGPCLSDRQRAKAAAAGIDIREAPFRLEWMPEPWDDVDRAGEWLLSIAQQTTPDVVHLNGYCHAALPWHAPVIVVGHSCVRTWWRGVYGEPAPDEWNVYTDRVAEGLRTATLVVTPTHALLDALRGEYGDIGRARVIPNGSHAVDSNDEHLPKDQVVFSAGRLWDEAKNVAAVCAAASDIEWRTCVAGDTVGPSGHAFVPGAAYCVGRLTAEEMSDWYRRAAIYALPARYEPFGLSVLEAAAAGCALVLGDIRTLRENWSGAAVFVPPDNRRALARAIQELIDDPARRAELGRLAHARAARFTVRAMTGAYLDTYNRLVPPAAAA